MKSLNVQGFATIKVPFSTELSMTREEFNNMHIFYKTDLISTHVDWNDQEIYSSDVSRVEITDTTYVDPKTGNPIED